MSRYPPRILINNPEKTVPASTTEQFFLALKSGDVDTVRDFALRYKNKYNLIDKGGKGADANQSPFHTVLELDERVADDQTKLRMMKYLDMMGAPMDTPNGANVWPIHLAASSQSEPIVDFMIGHKVDLNRTDSSNNTPLHYSIIGKSVACPKPVSIQSIVPPLPIDKQSLNQVLTTSNARIIKYLTSDPILSGHLIHMINTLSRIPLMYEGTATGLELKASVSDMYATTALDPLYQTQDPIFSPNTAKLEGLVEKMYTSVNQELLKGLTNASDIKPNNGGWGPTTPDGQITSLNPSPPALPPTQVQRILPVTIQDMQRELFNEYNTARNTIIARGTAIPDKLLITAPSVARAGTGPGSQGSALAIIPAIYNQIDENYIDPLIFCPGCESMSKGERITTAKILYITTMAYHRLYYAEYLTTKIFNTTKLMNQDQFGKIMTSTYRDKQVYDKWIKNEPNTLFMSDLPSIINSPAMNGTRNVIDSFFATSVVQVENHGKCIAHQLRALFTDSDEIPNYDLTLDRDPHDELGDGDLGTIPLWGLMKRDPYAHLLESYNDLPATYKQPINNLWFRMLDTLLVDIKPEPLRPSPPRSQADNNSYAADRVFGDNKAVPKYWMLPSTPFAHGGKGGTQRRGGGIIQPGTGDRIYTYTYGEMFRVMEAVKTFLSTGNFQIRKYPEIYNRPIEDWKDYIDTVAALNVALRRDVPDSPIIQSGDTIESRYPAFIYLYKMLAVRVTEHLRDIMTECIDQMISVIPALDPVTAPLADIPHLSIQEINDQTSLFKRFIKADITDLHIYILLLPSSINPDAYIRTDPNNLGQPDSNDPLLDLKARVWAPSNSLLIDYLKELPDPPDIELIINSIYPPAPVALGPFPDPLIPLFEYAPIFRQAVAFNYLVNQNVIDAIIDGEDMRSSIDKYIKARRIMPRYNILTMTMPLDTQMPFYPDPWNPDTIDVSITGLYFLTELVNKYFVDVKRQITYLAAQIRNCRDVISDIIMFIRGSKNYYVAQIFLPALIKQAVRCIKSLIDMRSMINHFNTSRIDYESRINLEDPEIASVLALASAFGDYMMQRLSILYTEITDLTKYHDEVIDFLNKDSAWNLIQAQNAGGGASPVNLFNRNLIPLGPLPNLFSGIDNIEAIETVLHRYSIPHTAYYDTGIPLTPQMEAVFGLNVSPPAIPSYRGIITYQRSSGAPSEVPTFYDNSQLNIAPGDPTYHSILTKTAYEGEWLYAYEDPKDIYYWEAFIAFLDNYPLVYLRGMPPSISSFLSPYLRTTKQTIIQEAVQGIINNHHTIQPPAAPATPAYDPELDQLYTDIQKLGTESVPQMVDDAKVYVVIAKLVDATINQLLEYTVRQSVSNWVLVLATSSAPTPSLIDSATQTIRAIQNELYLKINLSTLDQDAVNRLLAIDPLYIDSQLIQIEQKPSQLKYSTLASEAKLIHYLYDINYFSVGNIDSNSQCFLIDPSIPPKLMTSSTINAPNSDGQTPLHLAISLTYPDLVDLLLKHGAKANTFKNNRGETPIDLAVKMLSQHVGFTESTPHPRVIDTISPFAVPFNDLLLARLRDEKYGQNIIRDITAGIPIQLVMYNHMFYLYLENYRYGFSYDLKERINGLLNKYEHVAGEPYPYDLFAIKGETELEKLVATELPTTRINASLEADTGAQNRQSKTQVLISSIDTQLTGLRTEEQANKDPNLRNLIQTLEAQKTSLESKLLIPLAKADPNSLRTYALTYEISTQHMRSNIPRGLDLTGFYTDAFQRIGRTPSLYLGVWDAYLNKSLINAPSMLFPHLDRILQHLASKIKAQTDPKPEPKSLYNLSAPPYSSTLTTPTPFDPTIQTELNTIAEFYERVRTYIEAKNPNGNIEEDPQTRAEFEQIVYLINLIITPSMYQIVLRQIVDGVIQADALNTITQGTPDLINRITQTKVNNQTLEQYMYGVLPLLAAKYYSTTYAGPQDPTRRLNSATDLFAPITTFAKGNPVYQLTDESVLVSNITNHLIPFMSNTYQYFIHHLRLAIYGYDRYLLNSYQLVRILSVLAPVAEPLVTS
ncbi:Ankyrin repeat protein [uncultured virus]|nr:Ankyrin repeat protein [uncultured virus]